MTTLLEKISNFFEILLRAFIGLQKLGFEWVGDFSYYLRYYSLDRAIIIAVCGVLMIGSVLVLDIGIILIIYISITSFFIKLRTKEIVKKPVIGMVTSKTYKKEWTTFTGYMLIRHPEKYYMKVEYDEISGIFDNKELFEKYEKNDSISLVLIQNLDKNNKVIMKRLELPE